MDRQFKRFAGSLNPAPDRRFKILDLEKNGDELKIVIGTSEPPSPHTCFHFRGVKDFDTFIFGGDDGYSLPQSFNSFMSSARPHYEAMYLWELRGDGAEWAFIAPYPEVILL
ncbi:MAG TPA: hypothetical protein VF656_02705 [Pyrinomonadaceae bacterium]